MIKNLTLTTNLIKRLWKTYTDLRFEPDGQEPAFLHEPIDEAYQEVVDAKIEVHKQRHGNIAVRPKKIDTQDIWVSTNFLPVNYMNVTRVDKGRLACGMIYQGYKAQDQLRQTQNIVREHKQWLTLNQYIKVKTHMEKVLLYTRRFRTQFRHKYAEDNLVNVWSVFWAQTRYEFPFTEVERQIDKMSENVLRGHKDRGLIINVNDEDAQALKKYTTMLQYHLCGDSEEAR